MFDDILGWSRNGRVGWKCDWGWSGVEKGKDFEGVVLLGAEAFESGHTCLSCERPFSPWLAGIPEQRQRETETERVECERRRVKRESRVRSRLGRGKPVLAKVF